MTFLGRWGKRWHNFVTYINSNLPPYWTTACTRNLQKTDWRPNLAPNYTGIWANPWGCSHRPPDNGTGTAFSAATTSKDKMTFVNPAVMMASLAQHFQGFGSKVHKSALCPRCECNVATADARKSFHHGFKEIGIGHGYCNLQAASTWPPIVSEWQL